MINDQIEEEQKAECDRRVNKARRQWGKVFDGLRGTKDYSNSAWYFVKDKNQWIDEEINRLRALIRDAEKAIQHWEERRKR
jgi:hypothetical protein